MNNNYKIAFVKQDVYQDLYVCPVTEKNPANVVFSSIMRVGPIGLIAELGADFYIVKEDAKYKETQIYKEVLPHIAHFIDRVKTTPLNEIEGNEFMQPGSRHVNGDFSVSAESIDWSKYDIVISINVSIPTKLIRANRNTLFCYMIGEANMYTNNVYFGYDCALTQMGRGIEAKKPTVIDFPYSFVGRNTLNNLMHNFLNRESTKTGIYVEISGCEDRPATKPLKGFLTVSEATGQPLRLHKQLIKDNLIELYDSKYFLKLGTFKTRGNSIVEAISCGTLVIANKKNIIHHEVIPEECNLKTEDEIIQLITELDKHPEKYNALLKKQQDLLEYYIYSKPYRSLVNALHYKRNTSWYPFYNQFRTNKLVILCFTFIRRIRNWL